MAAVPLAHARLPATDPRLIIPLDVPTVEDIPLGDGSTTLDIDPNGVNISGAIEGVPVGVRIDRQGVRIDQLRPTPTATASATPVPAVD